MHIAPCPYGISPLNVVISVMSECEACITLRGLSAFTVFFFRESCNKMKYNVRAKLYYLPYPELRSLLGVYAYRG